VNFLFILSPGAVPTGIAHLLGVFDYFLGAEIYPESS
jgi:hypothetical protein